MTKTHIQMKGVKTALMTSNIKSILNNLKKVCFEVLIIIMQMNKAKKKKSRISRNPTDPTFLVPSLNFLETSESFTSIFRVFLNDFHAFINIKFVFFVYLACQH